MQNILKYIKIILYENKNKFISAFIL